ncbi:MAG: hypothetical protein WAW84_04195 [Candidatus Rickettsiella isopodorum]|jgi:hypothetical protein|nr:hypothetical protein [Gammaproteobacteria bacterium]MCH9754434.1 hypothetical protein [Gammaproteobacteria bacterium]MDD4893022.1 hypothetical protein [Candidatus Rickettsiella isopodorum]MDD5161835.1 hypothetical protein [Candidatus Rickettsiella isopodorum]
MQNNLDDPIYIINLSAIPRLASISHVIDNFSSLHYQYAESRLHFEWYSKLWVSLKYLTITSSINGYKLGKIATNAFISKLQAIFYFLPAQESTELLERTWNSLIIWDIESTKRLGNLIDKNKPIYFISNTNPLNIERIIGFFNQYSNIAWELPKEQTEAKPLKIANNFFLCPSYLFKEGTPSLISTLKNSLLAQGKNLENLLLVSQFQRDLGKAKELGIKWQSADSFFNNFVPNQQLSFQPLNGQTMTTSTIPVPLLLNNLAMNSRQNFFGVENERESIQNHSEKTPLLRQ